MPPHPKMILPPTPPVMTAVSSAVPTPVSTPTPIVTPIYFHRQRLGSEKDAKSYIQKIQHETLRISVIERLEGYLAKKSDEDATAVDDSDDDDDTGKRPASPVEEQIGMWVDQCKCIFLWYYNIYLVLPS